MVNTRKNKVPKAATVDATLKSVVIPQIIKGNPKTASDKVPTGKSTSDAVEKTTVLKNPKALVPEKKKLDKSVKEMETVVQMKENEIPKSIPEQIPKKATTLKTSSGKEPAKKSTQEVISKISKSLDSRSPSMTGVSLEGSKSIVEKPKVVASVQGEKTLLVKGVRRKAIATKKSPEKDKFKVVKRRVVVSESDDEESEEREEVGDAVEKVNSNVPVEKSSNAEEEEEKLSEASVEISEGGGEEEQMDAVFAKDVVEEPLAEDEANSHHVSDEVDESLQELFDAVEDYVEEAFASKTTDEEMEALSEDSVDESVKLSDLVKDSQEDVPVSKEHVTKSKQATKTRKGVLCQDAEVIVPAVTEKKASKKRKASAPSPAEKLVETIASGQEKAVSPAAKKIKTCSPTGKVKEKGKKVQFESGVVVNGVWFVSNVHTEKWKFVQKRKIVAERVLEADKYAAKEIVSLIKGLDLWPSVSMAKPFSANLVREVIVNLPEEFADIESASFGMASVRGKEVVITPDGINDYFGIEGGALIIGENPNWHKTVSTLTGGVRSKWYSMTFPVKDLSTKHSLLHSIAVHNWLPNNHHTTLGHTMGAFLKTTGAGKKNDLGRLIFDQIASHATSVKVNLPIGFLSLIHQLVVGQHPDILTSQDVLTGIPKVFLADHKHFSGKHIVDLDVEAPIKPKKKLSETTLEELSAHIPSATRRKIISHLEEELADVNERIMQYMARKKKITKLLVGLRYPEEEDEIVSGDDVASAESDY